MSDLKGEGEALLEDSLDQDFSNPVVALSCKPPRPKDPRSKSKYNFVSRILFL